MFRNSSLCVEQVAAGSRRALRAESEVTITISLSWMVLVAPSRDPWRRQSTRQEVSSALAAAEVAVEVD